VHITGTLLFTLLDNELQHSGDFLHHLSAGVVIEQFHALANQRLLDFRALVVEALVQRHVGLDQEINRFWDY